MYLVHMANISYRLAGRKLKFDAATRQFCERCGSERHADTSEVSGTVRFPEDLSPNSCGRVHAVLRPIIA